MPAGAKRWSYPEPCPDLVEEISRELSLLPSVARVIASRGITTAGEAGCFLNPSLDLLHSPFDMKGMRDAVNRLVKALEKNEKILVYGDYDVDGITATVLLTSYLQRLGGNISYFLPSRFQEGYGLQKSAILQYREQGCSLMVTVDCGINSAEEVLFSREQGMDVIITDHHYPLVTLEGAAVINPHQPECSYPWKSLAGVGVAFKLLCALQESTGENHDPFDYLDLVALGTVADIVPLMDENRVLTVYGLKKINLDPNPGLKTLIEACGMAGKTLSERDLAFGLAPSINAAGRMGEADPAAKLLMSREKEEAVKLASFLVNENKNRRSLESSVYAEAEAIIEDEYEGTPGDIIVLGREGWHYGVIGIVAARLSDMYYRPVVLVAFEDDRGRGSARSIPGFHITEALRKCGDLLEKYGGHEQAAGLTVNKANIDELRKRLCQIAENGLKTEDLVPGINLDGELTGPEIGPELARQLEMLAPFGTGNEFPRFCTRGWEVRHLRLVGKDKKHLKLRLNKKDKIVEPIFFSADTYMDKIIPGQKIDMIFTLKNGSWQDRPVLNMEIRDISCAGSEEDGLVEVIDMRERENKLSALKGVLGFTGEPVIYIGSMAQQEFIRAKILIPDKAVFIHPRLTDMNGIKPGNICNIILYHLPVTGEVAGRIFGHFPDDAVLRVHLLFDEKDKFINEKITEAALPSLSRAGEFYLFMKDTADDTGFFCAEKTDDLKKMFSGGMTQYMFDRCMNIVKEAGLAEEVPGGWRIAGETTDIRSRMEDTKTYRDGVIIKNNSLEYQDFLLEADARTLCTHIKELRKKKT